ncbi:MAG: AraC family transcriptional regulator [Actinomycetales bacterium]
MDDANGRPPAAEASSGTSGPGTRAHPTVDVRPSQVLERVGTDFQGFKPPELAFGHGVTREDPGRVEINAPGTRIVAMDTRHVDEAREMLARFETYRIQPLGNADDFHFLFQYLQQGPFAVFHIRYGTPVMVSADKPLDNIYCVAHAVNGAARLSHGKESVDLHGTNSVVCDQRRQITAVREAGAELVMVRIDLDIVRTHLVDLGYAGTSSATFDMDCPTTAGDRQRWQGVVGLLEQSLGAAPGEQNDLWFDGLGRFIVSSMLATHPNTMITQAAPVETMSASARAARQAAEYLRAHHDQPVRVGAMAEDLHLSPRSLQLAFRRQYGVTITEFLRELRLNSAHRQLMEDPNANVADVAYRWGFSSASRFAAQHREYFGVQPSQVMTRGR